MKTEKKAEIIRLVIFYLFAFLPLCILTIAMNSTVDDGYIYNHMEDKAALVYALGVFGMLFPSIAVVITRLITKEGFKNSYLAINFKGNVKYYAASVLVFLVKGLIETLLMWKLFSSVSFSEMFPSDNMAQKIWLLIINIEGSLIMIFSAFGEEWGWRGYMMPKLIKLMGKPVAVIVGGILWGLWHAPLTMSGHNFGTDYKYFPWLGIVLMCVFCTVMNAFLTLLSERTKSVYPCAFAHAINNNISALMFITIFGDIELPDMDTFTMQDVLIRMVPIITIGIVSFILFVKKPSSEEKSMA